MGKRGPGQKQKLPCPVCKDITVHEIGLDIGDGANRSKSVVIGELAVYRRDRMCTECGSANTTVEFRLEDFESLTRSLKEAKAELKGLREFKDAVFRASEKLKPSRSP